VSANYLIRLYNANDELISASLPFAKLSWTISEMAVGNLSLIIPGGMVDSHLFKPEYGLEVWRRIDNGAPRLVGDRWLVNQIQILGNNGDILIGAADYNSLLANRIIDYPASTPEAPNAYTEKSGHADDIIKAFVRENIGSLATDTSRIIAGLNIDPDFGLAPNINKSASRKNLLTTAQDIALNSRENGTYLTWGWKITEDATTFVTAINQWGEDHGASSSNQIIISSDFGNLLEPVLIDDYSQERNVIKMGGLGEGPDRIIGSATGSRATANKFSRKEYFGFGYSTDNINLLNGYAETKLMELRARRVLTGRIAETETLRYGIDVDFGDIVMAEYAGYTMDCRLSTVSGEVAGGVETRLDLVLHGEELL